MTKTAAKPVVKRKVTKKAAAKNATHASATPKTPRGVDTPAAAVSGGGSNGSRRILVPALLAVAVGAIMLALWRTVRKRRGNPRTTSRSSQTAAYTDTTTTGWMTREEQWLLDGKHAYLAAADAAGVSAFEQFLESHGVPFLVDRRGDAVVFSAQQT